jgi:hypothetical protein
MEAASGAQRSQEDSSEPQESPKNADTIKKGGGWVRGECKSYLGRTVRDGPRASARPNN